MPHVANLAGAMVFVVGDAMRVADGLRTKYKDGYRQQQDQQPYRSPFSHVRVRAKDRSPVRIKAASVNSGKVEDVASTIPVLGTGAAREIQLGLYSSFNSRRRI